MELGFLLFKLGQFVIARAYHQVELYKIGFSLPTSAAEAEIQLDKRVWDY